MAELLLIVPTIIFGTHMGTLDESFNFGSSVEVSYFKPPLDFSLTRRRRNFRTRRFGFRVVARLLWFFRYVKSSQVNFRFRSSRRPFGGSRAGLLRQSCGSDTIGTSSRRCSFSAARRTTDGCSMYDWPTIGS